MKTYVIILILLANLCARAEIKLNAQPLHSSGLPGELQKIDLQIEMDSPRETVLRVPHASNLLVRAVERYPVRRTKEGAYLLKRQLVLQGLESGVTVLTNILVETGSDSYRFPPLTVEVLDVKKAMPPEKPKPPDSTAHPELNP